MQKKLHIKVGDAVKVLSGEHRGQEGRVLSIDRSKDRATVEGVNVIKRHTKPDAANPQGGIVEKEAPIHISNLSLLTSKGETTRVGYRIEDGKKVRFSKKSNEVL